MAAFSQAAPAACASRARSAATQRCHARAAATRAPLRAPAAPALPAAVPRASLRRAAARPLRAAAAGGDGGAAGEVGIGDLVQLSLGGFACAEGFVALLVPPGAALPAAQNAVERLRGAAPPAPTGPPDALCLPLRVTRDAADGFSPTSPRALTLLQLAQTPPIDMGAAAVLPYDALAKLTGDEESLLGAAIVATAGDAAAAASGADGSAFAATLLAGGSSGVPGSYDTADAWLAVALALRYSPYGARLFATQAALAAAGVPLGELAARFPGAVSAADVAAEGAAAADSLRRAFINADLRRPDAPPAA